jgi:basic amino acid/polyamine antiporter, APA family
MSESAQSKTVSQTAAPKRQLSLFDSTCIIVGIIIGAGIYQSSSLIASSVSSGGILLLLWLVGGVLSLCGAMGYAELASAYPREGGDYVYLTKAYGPWAGFLFGWLQLLVSRPSDIVSMAFVFATYSMMIFNPLDKAYDPIVMRLYAVAAVAFFTAINVLGVTQGKWTQNLLTVVKALCLLAIVAVAMLAPHGEKSQEPFGGPPWTVALIIVLFTYGGWNEMAYVAAEVKDSSRNIVRALMLGTGAVMVLYLLVTGAFLFTLGHAGMANSKAVAADAISTIFPQLGSAIISAMVCISALGAVNGLIFTGARIPFAVGVDHRAFRLVGVWNEKTGTPVRALLLQGMIAIVLIIALGSFIEAVIYASAAVYLFYLATSAAVIILRFRDPQVQRPYRVTLFPIPTLIFCVVCGYLIYSAIDYKPLLSVIALGIVALGYPVYWFTSRRK